MKRIGLFVLIGAGLLAGCSHRYVITLKNGTQLTTAGKPRFERGNYYFKDINGQSAYVPEGRVEEIAPASMAEKAKVQLSP